MMNKKAVLVTVISVLAVVLAVMCGVMLFQNRNKSAPTLDVSLSKTEATTEIETEPGTTALYPENVTLPQKPAGLSFSYPYSSSLTVSKERFGFMGSAVGDDILYCNGTAIETNDEDVFAFDVLLSPGENTYEFVLGDTSETFIITYDSKLIASVSPSGDIAAQPGTEIAISASCKKGSSVYAVVDGSQISMTSESTDSSYAYYEGVFTIPNVTQVTDMGNITVYASLDGSVESVDGGNVTAVAGEVKYASYIPTATDSDDNPITYTSRYDSASSMLTPTTDYGRGTMAVCEILKDNTECTPASALDDRSSPLCTPLLQGTFDYITGMCTYDDEVMFTLGCGKKVYAKETRVYENGYILPTNNLDLLKTNYTADSTDIYFKTDWMIPVNIELKPQTYYLNTQGRPYAVEQLECEYLEITFYYTNITNGNIDLSSSKCLSSFEWSTGENCSVLRLYLKNPGFFYGYSFTLDSDGVYKLSVNNRPATQGVKTVMLDPGHGGEDDSGTYTTVSGIYEKDVNLAIAVRTANILTSKGYNVIFTRTTDTRVTLNDRNLLARQSKPDVFVSIHCDGDSDSTVSGTHVFYYYSYSSPLSASIYNKMVAYYQSVYPAGTSAYENIMKGSKFYPYQVARIEECPSVLVECGYLTNPYDSGVLLSENGLNGIASAIAEGIDYYLTNC